MPAQVWQSRSTKVTGDGFIAAQCQVRYHQSDSQTDFFLRLLVRLAKTDTCVGAIGR